MKMILLVIAAAMASPLAGLAQTPPVSMGHLHLNVSNIAAQTKFWTEQFDAKPVDRPGLAGVAVPGMLILFEKTPEHGSVGTILDHFGFKVKSRDEMVSRARAAGYAVPREFKGSEGFPNAYIDGPDGLKVELQEDASLQGRAVAQHLHFLLPDYLELRDWYIRTFSMQKTTRGPHESADIPGMNLTFAIGKQLASLPTKGGLIDHIAFEVKNLEAFCRQLESAGVKFDIPFQRHTELGFASAFLTDPHGVSIELTEGLAAAN